MLHNRGSWKFFIKGAKIQSIKQNYEDAVIRDLDSTIVWFHSRPMNIFY